MTLSSIITRSIIDKKSCCIDCIEEQQAKHWSDINVAVTHPRILTLLIMKHRFNWYQEMAKLKARLESLQRSQRFSFFQQQHIFFTQLMLDQMEELRKK
ncbi:hypothetical protein GW17_00038436 [Ensete ventricosum]|nr:hypothetical protein GW17_00038436 [Ensete ventricosum]